MCVCLRERGRAWVNVNILELLTSLRMTDADDNENKRKWETCANKTENRRVCFVSSAKNETKHVTATWSLLYTDTHCSTTIKEKCAVELILGKASRKRWKKWL